MRPGALVLAGGPPAGRPVARRPATPTAPAPERLAAVIVQSNGDARAAVAAVRAAGGTVTRELPIVDGVSARVPASALGWLASSSGILAVTADDAVRTSGSTDAVNTSTIKQAFLQSTGVSKLHSAGFTGTGVRVALIDTGVTPGTDLAGRVVPVLDANASSLSSATVVPCVNFSGESTCDDTYGHGTFMAGLIAGDGSASGGQFSGAAPGAQIVSIKIAGATGAADVTKVLAAIQWVVSFGDRYGIKVLNLSLGTNSTRDPAIDPLNRAVQRAWQAGIAVVVASGNSGRPKTAGAWTVTKPGDDPLVLTVGATDDRETPGTSDDRVPRFASRGSAALAKPDVVAPGAHVVSLRAPGSTIDRLGTKLDDTYRRGSGTSMSAAIVSGAVAALRQARPTWTPDQVKYAVRETSRKVALSDPYAIGRGLLDVAEATRVDVRQAPVQVSNQGVVGNSLDATRAGLRVVGTGCSEQQQLRSALAAFTAMPGPVCAGDMPGDTETAQGRAFDGAAYSETQWSESTWYASQWATGRLGNDWTGNDWTGNDWTGNDWTGNDWTGNDWTGADWDGGSDEQESYGGSGSLARGSILYGSAR